MIHSPVLCLVFLLGICCIFLIFFAHAASSVSDLRSLVVQEVITLEKAPQFYLGDKFNKFRLANQDNLLDFFPGKRKVIKTYVKENNINFTIREDIIKMLVYLQGMDQSQGQ